jgi:hypothetical protein
MGMKIICLIRTIYRTLCSEWFWEGVAIDGCDLVEQDNGSLECKICGRVSNFPIKGDWR